jgi:hypothetical protein
LFATANMTRSRASLDSAQPRPRPPATGQERRTSFRSRTETNEGQRSSTARAGSCDPFTRALGARTECRRTHRTASTRWRSQSVPFQKEHTRGITASCLEPEDLVVAKLLTRRSHDLELCGALLRTGIVDTGIVRKCHADAVVDSEQRAVVDCRPVSVNRPSWQRRPSPNEGRKGTFASWERIIRIRVPTTSRDPPRDTWATRRSR